jgi:enterochelin esterase family protein
MPSRKKSKTLTANKPKTLTAKKPKTLTQAQRRNMPRGTVDLMSIDSEVLRDNALGDPAVRHVPVYLPPGYGDSQARYPVLVALTGFTGSGRMMLNAAAWGESFNERMDRLLAEGRIGPMIVVMPDCFTRLGGSQYLNSSATGRYEDHLIREIVPQVDATYRTLPEARHRGVFGKSSGGYGAIVQGMKHPDVFGAVACHSGDMAFEYGYLPDFPKLLAQVQQHGSIKAFVKAFETAPRKTGAQIGAMNVLAMAACYSPDPESPHMGIAFPMHLHTGAIDERIWRRWLRQDPLRMAERHADNLRRLRLLFIDCGWRDEYNLHLGARQLVARLEELGVPCVHEEFEDGHMGLNYRYDRSLPLLWKAVRPTGR